MSESSTVFVYTINTSQRSGAWSTYVFPGNVDYQTQLDNDIYLRIGDLVVKVNEDLSTDAVLQDDRSVVLENFDSTLWWPFIDCGTPGVTKRMIGFDLVSEGDYATVEFGYNQRDFTMLTASYEIPGDTLDGGIIPFPMAAPTISMKITYDSADGRFEWLSTNLYLEDNRMTS